MLRKKFFTNTWYVGKTSNFWSQIETFVKNPDLCQKSKFSSKIEILVKNRNLCQKSKFWSKIGICVKNRNFHQKFSKVTSTTNNFRLCFGAVNTYLPNPLKSENCRILPKFQKTENEIENELDEEFEKYFEQIGRRENLTQKLYKRKKSSKNENKKAKIGKL